MIQERLKALRAEMEKRGITVYVVPTADFHESEYVGDHFKARKFITGFTGSAGTAVITLDEAGLWTDGRYFVQAENQLKDSTVTLYRMGEEGVPTVDEFVKDRLKEGGCLGFDGRVVNGTWGGRLEKIAAEKNVSMHVTEDLIDLIWEDRPALSKQPLFILEEKYSGKSTADKIADLRKAMKENGADVHILTSLYDIAWLLNIRGNDIDYVPVVLSYLVLNETECIWFLQEEVVDDKIRAYLEENHITTKPYDAIYDYVPEIPADAVVLMNRGTVNYRIVNSLDKAIKVVDKPNPTELMKAVKNKTEVDNTRAAHVKDGVAFTKFMYWLKTNIGKIPMTEISASDYLEARRREQDNFIELSFNTICAYGANAAMMHYAATPESDAELKPEGFLLVDSGGHYFEGTTDITSTFNLWRVGKRVVGRTTLPANDSAAQTLNQHFRVNINVDYCIQLTAIISQHLVEGFGLRQVAREAIQHETLFGVILSQTFLHNAIRNFVRDQFAFIDIFLGFQTHWRFVLDCCPEDITS